MGNSCNHEHLEEIEEDTSVFAARGGEEDICQNLFSVSVSTVISSYLEFKGYSAVPDCTVWYRN